MRFSLFRKSESGVSAVEFALVSPLLLLVLMGVAQVSMWVWTNFALQHGAEAAARCASITPATCGTTAAIQQYAAAQSYGLNVAASSFTVDTAAACGVSVSAKVQMFESISWMGTFTSTALACFPK
ncbi:MAG: pilus assembly protein [Hyphomicrobiales bacterium]|nr:pilus assembly protein [Hyphomicrobiales bacterium]